MQSNIYDTVVIGGGISGLGFAHYSLHQGRKTLLVEKEAACGGCIDSHAFPEADGFWTELGAHTCYNSYGHLLGILEDLGLTERLLAKRKLRYSLLVAGARHSIVSRLHPVELLSHGPRLFFTSKTDKSVEEYYTLTIGERNYRELFSPAFDAVICQPAGAFPADALFRKKPRHKGVVRSFTLDAGLGAIVQALADQPGLESMPGTGAQAVEKDHERFRVTLADGRHLLARQLALAVPPDTAAALLRTDFPKLAALLGRIEMATVESVALVTHAGEVAMEPLAGLIAVDTDFYSMLARDYLPDERFRGFSFHFRPGHLDAPAQDELMCRVLSIHPERIVATRRRLNRLPALRKGHTELTQEIDRALAGTGLGLCGNYFAGVSIEDSLARSHHEFRRLRD